MTIKEFYKLDNLCEDINTLEALMDSIKNGHWIKLNSPELHDDTGKMLRYFETDLEEFIKTKYNEAISLLEQIQISGLDRKD